MYSELLMSTFSSVLEDVNKNSLGDREGEPCPVKHPAVSEKIRSEPYFPRPRRQMHCDSQNKLSPEQASRKRKPQRDKRYMCLSTLD